MLVDDGGQPDHADERMVIECQDAVVNAAVLESLMEDLDEAISLLRDANEDHWQAWLQRGRDQLANSDAHGAEHILSAFGGMGSLNDLLLAQGPADDRLHELRESIWRGCRAVTDSSAP